MTISYKVPKETFSDAVQALNKEITEHVSGVMRLEAKMRERLVVAWLAETGLLPSESEMVIQTTVGGNIRFYMRRLSDLVD